MNLMVAMLQLDILEDFYTAHYTTLTPSVLPVVDTWTGEELRHPIGWTLFFAHHLFFESFEELAALYLSLWFPSV